jgi:uncharacterized protein (TIGR02147 family)
MNKPVYSFKEYKPFLRHHIGALPKKGHGELARIAAHLELNPAHISQIINGPKDFTLEQGHDLAAYLGLSALESDYFFLLLEKDRAGTHRLKKYFEAKMEKLKTEAQNVAKRFPKDHKMDEAAKSNFYSNWMYSAVRLITSMPQFTSVDAIAKRMQLSRARTTEVLRFLVENGLCVEEKGRYKMGPQRTHLERESPHIGRHRSNWRIKALHQMDTLSETELMFTAPMTMSREDFAELKEELMKVIERLSPKIKDSKPESLFCLNIDLFEVR